MPALILSIYTAIAAWLASFGTTIVGIITVLGLSYLAIKILMFFIFGVVLPLIFYNVMHYYAYDMIVWAMAKLSSFFNLSSINVAINITGFAGYIGQHLKVVEAISLTLSASLARFLMDFVPFMGGKR